MGLSRPNHCAADTRPITDLSSPATRWKHSVKPGRASKSLGTRCYSRVMRNWVSIHQNSSDSDTFHRSINLVIMSDFAEKDTMSRLAQFCTILHISMQHRRGQHTTYLSWPRLRRSFE